MSNTINALRIETENALRIFNPSEAEILTRYLLEDIAGIFPLDIVLTPHKEISKEVIIAVKEAIEQLKNNKPIQYITQKAHFDRLTLFVNQYVLIPRPETEELVNYVDKENADKKLHVADICCGSGCIGIALQKRNPDWLIYMTDVSLGALQVAQKNSINLNGNTNNTKITAANFLNSDPFPFVHQFDIICCNPPYIPLSASHLVEEKVKNYEPSLALFEPVKQRAIFYIRLAEYAQNKLKSRGIIYAEIHFDAAEITTEIFTKYGFQVQIIKDINQHDRIIIATRN